MGLFFMSLKFYSNFEIALNKLNQFVSQEIKDDLDRAGLIQGFEFTFEQCWKAVQKKAKEEGVDVNSPKQAFSTLLSWGWISPSDENLWLEMIKDRNLTSHTYREEMSLNVSKNIIEIYTPAFNIVLGKMIA